MSTSNGTTTGYAAPTFAQALEQAARRAREALPEALHGRLEQALTLVKDGPLLPG
jgi:hypothetical protein